MDHMISWVRASLKGNVLPLTNALCTSATRSSKRTRCCGQLMRPSEHLVDLASSCNMVGLPRTRAARPLLLTQSIRTTLWWRAGPLVCTCRSPPIGAERSCARLPLPLFGCRRMHLPSRVPSCQYTIVLLALAARISTSQAVVDNAHCRTQPNCWTSGFAAARSAHHSMADGEPRAAAWSSGSSAAKCVVTPAPARHSSSSPVQSTPARP